jgi:hypothetical protein
MTKFSGGDGGDGGGVRRGRHCDSLELATLIDWASSDPLNVPLSNKRMQNLNDPTVSSEHGAMALFCTSYLYSYELDLMLCKAAKRFFKKNLALLKVLKIYYKIVSFFGAAFLNVYGGRTQTLTSQAPESRVQTPDSK